MPRSQPAKSSKERAFRRRARVVVAIGLLAPTIAGSLVALVLFGEP
jgi:uncharacterized iron-regulated membrane protein